MLLNLKTNQSFSSINKVINMTNYLALKIVANARKQPSATCGRPV